jgi:membrane-associated phospholipid phosphatase
VLRLLLGALILLATMSAIHQHRIGVRETDVFRVVNDLALPGWTWPGVWLVMQLGVIGAVPLVVGLALLTRRWRLALYTALAGGTIYLVAKVVKEFVQRGRPQTLLDGVHILGEPARGLGWVSGHSAVAVALATVASPFLGRRVRRVAWVLAGCVCLARIYVGAHLPFDVLGGAALGWAAGALVLLVFGAPTGHPSLEQVRRSLHAYGFDPADLQPLPGQDRRSARYLVSSHSRPDLFVKVVSRERRDSDLLYRCWRWLAHRGRPASGCWTGTSPRCWRRWRACPTPRWPAPPPRRPWARRCCGGPRRRGRRRPRPRRPSRRAPGSTDGRRAPSRPLAPAAAGLRWRDPPPPGRAARAGRHGRGRRPVPGPARRRSPDRSLPRRPHRAGCARPSTPGRPR